ncbi:hypothetical protein [Streptomyces sp. NPDC020362]|uniref:hypothetical protein n=1 Tax=unclassified Streptomyces TaxID=2593676 RepID=UPI00340155CC
MVPQSKKPCPKQPAIRLGEINTVALVDRLRELYQAGGDPEFERFPATDELFLVLRHAGLTAGELKVDTSTVDPKDVMGEAAVIRAKVWPYLREQADAGQLKAIEAGRAVGMPWHRFNEALCVNTKHGAQQKAQRLKAEQVRRPDERRAPETARAHELTDAAEEVERLGRIARNLPRFPIAHPLCHQLLEHRDGLVVEGMSDWWLDGIAEVVDNRTTDLEKANLTDLLASFEREIHKLTRDRNQPATTTDEARQALTAATDFVPPPTAGDPTAAPPLPNWAPRTALTPPHTRRPPHRLMPALFRHPASPISSVAQRGR